MPHDAAAPRGAARFLPVLLLAAALSGGCSSGNAATKTVSGWFGAGSGSQDRTAYARSAGVVVYAEPSSGAKQVGRLGASEKVVRKNEKNGFARVSARGGKLVGWVAASKLTSKRPASKSVSTSSSPGAPAGAGDASAEAGQDGNGADAAPTDTTVTAGDAIEAADAAAGATPDVGPDPSPPAAPDRGSTKGVGASVFDPY